MHHGVVIADGHECGLGDRARRVSSRHRARWSDPKCLNTEKTVKPNQTPNSPH
jgi:hypothetical protein